MDIDNLKLELRYGIWEPVRNYFQRIWFCHHNAKVIAAFEDRMSSVIYAATNGKMSKPYYSKEVMVSEIQSTLSEQYDLGYAEAKSDYDIKDE